MTCLQFFPPQGISNSEQLCQNVTSGFGDDAGAMDALQVEREENARLREEMVCHSQSGISIHGFKLGYE